jgi:pyroglutamyl-peptidase
MATVPKVLLTGFEPFDGERLNPSWEAVRRLDGARIARHRVVVARLPTEFERGVAALNRALDRHRPACVLCVGLAGGRAALSLERVALNVIDARIPDNAGRRPIDEPVIAGAAAAHFARLPLKSMLAALRRAGIPAEVSNSAGTFVCNAVYFALLERLAGTRTRGGFIHVPYLPAQVVERPGTPSLTLEEQVRGLRVAVAAALRRAPEARIAAGALH